MTFQHWQTGLDIQNGQLCALAVRRHRRYGWQLRNWWQHPLPDDILVNGVIRSSPPLIELLSSWRQRLPRSLSLRVGLHPQLVLQRQLKLPEPQNLLREPERSRYISAAARRIFPIDLQALTFDYRNNVQQDGVCLSAVRNEALHSWLHCLHAAGLHPDVVEQTPSALRVLASVLKLEADAVLIHGLADHWIWYAPHQPEPSGWCPRSTAEDAAAVVRLHLAGAERIYVSDSRGTGAAGTGTSLLPFSAFTLLTPPLPPSQQPFTLAAGLALRPEERTWSG